MLDRLASLLVGVYLLVLITPEGFSYQNTWSDLEEAKEGGLAVIDQLLMLGSYALALVILWRRRHRTAWQLRQINPFFLAFLAWCVLTTLWSPLPVDTLRTLVRLFGGIFIALALVSGERSHGEAMAALRFWFAMGMVASLLLALVMPDIGIEQNGKHAGLWTGLAINKNAMGGAAAMSALLWAHAFAIGVGAARWRRLGLLMLSVFLAIKSGSTTSLVLILLTVPTVLVLCSVHTQALVRSPMTWAVALAGLGVMTFLYVIVAGVPSTQTMITPIAELFGKDPTLTGRSDIWVLVYDYLEEHWLFGYGLGAFWRGLTGPSGEIAEQLQWLPWQAHNGFLDVVNETGVIGLTLLTLAFVHHFASTVRLWRWDSYAAVHLLLIVSILVVNISESSLTIVSTLQSFIMAVVLITHSLYAGRLKQRLRAQRQGGAWGEPGVSAARRSARLASHTDPLGGVS